MKGPIYNLGIALRLQGQSVEAAAEMREIRRLHQSRVQLAQSKKMILDGLNLLKEQQPREALKLFQQSVALNPSLPSPYYYSGLAQEKLGNSNKAEEAYTKALQLKPDSAEAHMSLGVLLGRQNENEAALKELKSAVLCDPDLAEAHYNLALMLARTGKSDEAVSELSTTISLKSATLGQPSVASEHSNAADNQIQRAAHCLQGRHRVGAAICRSP